MKMESLQQRREELERKEFQLKGSLLTFDKFLKVCLKIKYMKALGDNNMVKMFSIKPFHVAAN